MFYLVRVEDKQGTIKSYFKAPDHKRAMGLYESLCPGCTRKGDVVKLLDEDFNVVLSNTDLMNNNKEKH
ncbi:hypothetical protein GXP67_29110 [Rhodocytophaga rosea]|uniref:Uncharacterized protein n=1 Tax=Rhodocytophaga rosea TaxID=2704465 RepID=A0A6C0GQS8_9BACT|nr:hypothetical protein [Rhodocytophaga rosea]QHT70426.1 hypothetical protein GXP67_29110 [Rhodocytophaga rosea]